MTTRCERPRSGKQNRNGPSASSSSQANPIDLPIPDTDDDDSEGTIDYDPQNPNYTEYWATMKESLDVGTDYPSRPPDCIHDVKCDMVTDESDTTDYVEVAFTGGISQWLVADVPTRPLETDEVYVVRFHLSGASEIVIDKVMNNLTVDECHKHEAEVRQAIFDELERWRKLGGFRRTKRATAANIVDSRWVLKSKSVNGKRILKARLTIRGYKDQ